MILEFNQNRGVNLLYPWLLGPIQGIVVVVPFDQYRACVLKFFAADIFILCLAIYALASREETALIVLSLAFICFVCVRFRSQRVIKIRVRTITGMIPAPPSLYLENALHFLGLILVAAGPFANTEEVGPLSLTIGILLIALACIMAVAPVLYALRHRKMQG